MTRTVRLFAFVVAVLGVGLLIGSLTVPGPWYASLNKPSFNPPNWLFAPAWSILYVLIGIAGWRAWEVSRSGPLIKLWLLQMLLNFIWTPIFFRAQRIDVALIVIVLLLLAILAFIAAAWRRDRAAAWLFTPYAAWVAFASLLNGAIFTLN